MLASNEMTVRRTELAEAIRLVTSRIARVRKRSRKNWDWVILSGSENALTVTIEDGPTELIGGSGLWSTPIAVDALLLLQLSEKFPRTREITLSYLSGRLFLGPTNVPASEVVVSPEGIMNSRDEQLRIFRAAMQWRDDVEDELSYDDMHRLADMFEGWSMGRRMRPKDSAQLLGWAEGMRNLANRLGQDWNPECPEPLPVLAFMAKVLREGK